MLRDCLVLNVVTSAIALSAFEVPLAAEAKVLEANGGTSKKPVCILSKTSTKTGAKKKHKGKPLELLSGIASWYGHPFHGRRTASGQIFDMNKLTAAHLTIPLSSKVLVKNPQNGKAVVITVNDRGPYIKNRVIDLSYGAAKQLGILSSGLAYINYTVLPVDTESEIGADTEETAN